MSEIYVDHQRLQHAVTAFARHHEQLETVLSELEAGLAPMLGSWEGSARDLYQQKKTSWDAAARDLAHLLQSIVGLTRTAHHGYAEVVAKNAASWR